MSLSPQTDDNAMYITGPRVRGHPDWKRMHDAKSFEKRHYWYLFTVCLGCCDSLYITALMLLNVVGEVQRELNLGDAVYSTMSLWVRRLRAIHTSVAPFTTVLITHSLSPPQFVLDSFFSPFQAWLLLSLFWESVPWFTVTPFWGRLLSLLLQLLYQLNCVSALCVLWLLWVAC